MLRQEHSWEREKALAEGLREIAGELRLLEVGDLVAYIRTGRFGNVRTLVNSSAEMYFQPGTIAFGHSGIADLSWNGSPRISLDMEFHHQLVNVFFRLILEDGQAGVEIDYISFGDKQNNVQENTRRLKEAINNARIAPIPRSVCEAA